MKIFFRGHKDSSYVLEPSIYRDNLIENEEKIFHEIILRSPNEFISETSTIEKLVRMQHYGLPTRILDITSNPLVALYFACNGDEKKKERLSFLDYLKMKLNSMTVIQ